MYSTQIEHFPMFLGYLSWSRNRPKLCWLLLYWIIEETRFQNTQVDTRVMLHRIELQILARALNSVEMSIDQGKK